MLVGGEELAEVVVERAALESAGDRGREGSFGERLAVVGLVAVAEAACDDGAAEGSFGGVVGRLTPGVVTNVQSAAQIFSRLFAKTR